MASGALPRRHVDAFWRARTAAFTRLGFRVEAEAVLPP